MNTLLKSALLCGSLSLLACGGGESDSESIKEFKAIAKEGCECKDADCAKAASKKESDWRMKNYKGLSKEDRGKMKNARQSFTKCIDTLTK